MNLKTHNKRPYLQIKHVAKPLGKDQQGQNQWAVDETADIVFGQKWSKVLEAAVIIDIFNAKIVKNRLTKFTNEQTFEYYMKTYENLVGKAITKFLNENGSKNA